MRTRKHRCGRGKIICNVGPLPPRVECSVQPSAEEEEEAYQVAYQLFADACVEADARVFTYDRGGDDAARDALAAAEARWCPRGSGINAGRARGQAGIRHLCDLLPSDALAARKALPP